MKKILAIAKWEFFEKVKTKTFIISLIITPLIIISFSLIPTMFADKNDERTNVIGIVDSSEYIFFSLKNELEKYKLSNGQQNYVAVKLYQKEKSIEKNLVEADNEILSGKIEGCIIIFNGGSDSMNAEYRSRGIGNFRDAARIENSLNNARLEIKLKQAGADKSLLDFIRQNVKLNQVKVEEAGKSGKQDFLVIFFSSFIFIVLLMMMVIYSGQMLVRSLIEEKSNRLIEILVSSCTSDQLLTGKVLGLSLLGLTQMFIWLAIGLSLIGGSVIPVSVFDNLHIILIYFILGFLFYSTLFVGIGSILTTEQEAQQITTYLTLVLMLPVVLALPAMQNPDSAILKITSLIPLTIPTTMILRLNISQPSLQEFITSVAIMLFSTYILIKISARLFRIGILSYGARPTIKEIIQWLKSN